MLEGLELGVESDRVIDVDSPRWRRALEPFAGAAIPKAEVSESSLYLLIFTSCTSGAPKACLCSQGRLAMNGSILAQMMGFSPQEVCYCAMPLFHSNALMANWVPALSVGATCVLRRKFSASGFLPDVKQYGVTYFNYVGKPLAYVLATPEQPGDADNTLLHAFGNEASNQDIERFGQRFGCKVADAYGSTEGGVHLSRSEDMPQGSLGKGLPGVVVLDPETGEQRPPARFGPKGQLLNADEAIGEMANRLGATGFEGYWRNEEASAARIRDGIYWTGDLAYADEQGFLFFAGRDSEWLRVDGENFAAAPVERILARYPQIGVAAVYAVPDEVVGDQVMAALQLEPGSEFDPAHFDAFLAQQSDLGTKWAPRYLRISRELPVTQTNKVLKRALRKQHWECADPVWWKPAKGDPYRRLDARDIAQIRERFAERGRSAALDTL